MSNELGKISLVTLIECKKKIIISEIIIKVKLVNLK